MRYIASPIYKHTMQFRTEVKISKSEFKISHNQRGITVGSCFTTYIGDYLKNAKFPIMVNPLGTVYNPISVCNSLDIITGKRKLIEVDVHNENGIWQSYLLHSSFSALEKKKVFDACNKVQHEFATKFQKLDYVIVSLGTAWVYELKRTKDIVSNCHKSPSNLFDRKRLSFDEIFKKLVEQMFKLRQINPDLHIIFTISPIRHWKDGAHENNVSKAALLLAVNDLIRLYKNTSYFPAYEIMMDDLRDYRFYEEDMLHPSKQAVEYIWEKFTETYFSKETQEVNKKITEIQKAVEHRPFQKESEEYVKFLQKHVELCNEILSQNPEISLQKELQFLQGK